MVALAGKLMKMREYAVMLGLGRVSHKVSRLNSTKLFGCICQLHFRPSPSLEPCYLRRKPRMTMGCRPHLIVSGASSPNRIPPATCAGELRHCAGSHGGYGGDDDDDDDDDDNDITCFQIETYPKGRQICPFK